MRSIRIGNCSGFYGDRISAMREMLEDGPLDYLTGDYLAELTMLILGRDQMKDPSLGYAKTFVRQMADTMALAKERDVKIVTNAGGLNAAGLADKLREIAAEQGVDLKVAHVEGDKLSTSEGDFAGALTANAYLGAFGIAAALNHGADVVVTGRVTDASVIMGPAIAEFGWQREDVDALAGAVVAGHIIECGTQAAGGNYSGFTEFIRTDEDRRRPLGFPIAEVAEDGSMVITKHEGTGGSITVDTVTAQLVYEIQGPLYLNPDAAVRLDSIELAQEGPDRVRVSGIRGQLPPETTKVCLNSLGGFRNSVEFAITGLDLEEKAAWVKAQMEVALEANRPDEVVWNFERTEHEDPASERAAVALLACHVKSQDPNIVGRAFSSAAVELALASYAGFHVTAPPGKGSPFGVYSAKYRAQADVPHVVVHHDGTREEIPAPTQCSDAESLAAAAAPVPPAPELGATTRTALGHLAHARSGDKGGNANIGVWIPSGHARREEAYAWLANELTADRVRELLPEAADLPVDVHPLPNLAGLNIVIHGLLGEGVASSTRFDPQAKGLGEWLRARHTDIPEVLL